MDRIKNSVKSLSNSYKKQDVITFESLKNNGLNNVKPHDYQLYGIEWMSNSWLQRPSSGLILGDEMGLGKTLESVSFLLHLKYHHNLEDPFLILSPLSVIDGWNQEFKRSAPSLNVLTYNGNKDSREEMRQTVASNYMTSNWKKKKAPFDVLLTSYEICLKDTTFLQRLRWKVLVVDEAHRLKNSSSLLYQELQMFDIGFKVLLTGTPVQNNLKELYSLLSFVSPDIFNADSLDNFLEYFSKISQEPSSSTSKTDLHMLLKPFLLRRTKNEVILDLPKKSEVVVYCGMSEKQKKLYKAILLKDLDAFNQDHRQKTRLLNVLMQLRKCCNHPYIFPGIEPEPFQLGEHLVETSGKLKLLDRMLKLLKRNGHKVLVFSQMTTMLDIVQDYLGYRDYSYERLDGSVRGEERFLAVNNFNATDDTFIFLLSTRAGGQGLNLATADTVIFLDNDFNPQNDLQAAARAHRIGQTRPVKIIRLVCQNTAEEIILKRAESKLELTNAVIEGGQFSNVKLTDNPAELNDILKFGLDDLFNEEMKDIDEEELERLIGKTENGAWVLPEKPKDGNNQANAKTSSDTEEAEKENMYVFEGFDYSKTKTSEQDKSKFEAFVQAVNDVLQTERNLRKDTKGTLAVYLPDVLATRKRKVLTDDEKAELEKKRDENRTKRVKLMEEKNLEKLKKLRESLNYISRKVDLPDDNSDTDSISSAESDESAEMSRNDGGGQRGIEYVVGDLTQPVKTGIKDRIIAHCVDDSGRWGSGGLFTAIDRHSKEPKTYYELAAKAKDLELGDVHVIKFTEPTKTSSAVFVALIIAHTRDRNNVLSSLLMNHLSDALEKLYHVAKETGASIHFPRIGYNAPNFNWYGTEKLIKKTLAQRKIWTLIYYYKRRQSAYNKPSSSHAISVNSPTSSTKDIENKDDEETGAKDASSECGELSNIFTGCSVYFHGITDSSEVKKLSRYVIAYDGDVETSVTSQTTHIIMMSSFASATESLSSLNVNSPCVKIVSTDWIYACVKTTKMVNEEQYTISTDD